MLQDQTLLEWRMYVVTTVCRCCARASEEEEEL